MRDGITIGEIHFNEEIVCTTTTEPIESAQTNPKVTAGANTAQKGSRLGKSCPFQIPNPQFAPFITPCSWIGTRLDMSCPFPLT